MLPMFEQTNTYNYEEVLSYQGKKSSFIIYFRRKIMHKFNKISYSAFKLLKMERLSIRAQNIPFLMERFVKLNGRRLSTIPPEQSETSNNKLISVNEPPVSFDSDPDSDLPHYGSALRPTYNFAAYADKSVVLQEFIKLGVELYKLEKNLSIVQFLVELDYEKNVKPYLLFLHENGVPPDKFGNFITKNPLIFKEDLDDLKTRIDYLKSKRFTDEMISSIITKHPKWLSTPVHNIDGRLGYLQEIFNLKGDQIRKIITQVPKLATLPKKQIMINHHLLKEEMGLDMHQVKSLITEFPVLLRKDEYEILRTYEYLTKNMKIPVDLILKQPKILTYKIYIIRERHRYLDILGRAQYNPLLPGYVSLLSLIELSDQEFCEKIAMTSILTYNEFLKTQ